MMATEFPCKPHPEQPEGAKSLLDNPDKGLEPFGNKRPR